MVVRRGVWLQGSVTWKNQRNRTFAKKNENANESYQIPNESHQNRAPDYSHIKEVILCGTSFRQLSDEAPKFEIGLGSDQSDLLAFVCFVLKALSARAPRSLPNIAKYLITGRFVENFNERIDAGEKDFCFLRLRTLSNRDRSMPQRSGQSTPSLFMMSKKIANHKSSFMRDNLAKELVSYGRIYGYIEDMEDIFMSGGGNGLAKYLARINPGRHIALPPIPKSSKTLYLECDWLTPDQLRTPGILRAQMRRGRPLKTKICETAAEEKTSTATLERVSNVDADIGGWVMSW